jgi:uncharacterized protein YjbJ (UPF0337 family)
VYADVLKDNWQHIREQATQWWVELTDDDLIEIDGDRDKIIELIQSKCGLSRDDAEAELDRRLSEYERFVR